MSEFHQELASQISCSDIRRHSALLLEIDSKNPANAKSKENCLSEIQINPDFSEDPLQVNHRKAALDFCSNSNSSESFFLYKDLMLSSEDTQTSSYKFERSSTVRSAKNSVYEQFCKRFFLYEKEKSKERTRQLSTYLAVDRKSEFFSPQKIKMEESLYKCKNDSIDKLYKETKRRKCTILLNKSIDILASQKSQFEDINENSKDMLIEVNDKTVQRNNILKHQSLLSYINTSPKSEKILLEGLKKDFFSCIEKSEPEISYSCFVKILRKLSMLSDKNTEEKKLVVQLWNTITSEHKADKSKVLQYITAIMRYNTVNKKNQLSKQETEKIHKKYFLFFQNRLALKKPKKGNKQEFTFKPCINENSRLLISNLSEGSRLKMLSEKPHISEKIEKIKEEREKTIESECTFKPLINSSTKKYSYVTGKDSLVGDYQNITKRKIERTKALYSLANVVNERRKAKEEIKRVKSEEELSKFTFSPKINPEFKRKTPMVLDSNLRTPEGSLKNN